LRVFLEHTQFWLYKFFTDSRYRRFIFYTIFYGSKKRFVPKKINLGKNIIYAPDTLSFIWQYKEIFVDESYKFAPKTKDILIYDCGANIGVSCLYFSLNYPDSKIKAFEADPNIAKILSNNLNSNKIKNVEIIEKAVWKTNEGINISLEGSDGASIYFTENVVKVPSIRLKELIEKETKIDLLKMDIEGAEYEVLIDCKDSLASVDNLFIEVHSFTKEQQRLSEIFTILEKNNFRYFVKPVNDRSTPFINHKNKSNPQMDLQLNIFAYK
jgi:FkbM family methyltransferase